MSLYMPPISRKKKVDQKYSPNSFRVFGHPSQPRQFNTTLGDASDALTESKAVPYESTHCLKKHVPHACTADFLRENCRFVNEPVCMVYTDRDRDDKVPWWPRDVVVTPTKRRVRSLDTTFRRDYVDITRRPRGVTRHASNPNTSTALGIVPVNKLRETDGTQRFYKEKISYEHQFNSRLDPSYPVRAKRHGSFVWNGVPLDAVNRLLNQPGYSSSDPVYQPSGDGPISTQPTSNHLTVPRDTSPNYPIEGRKSTNDKLPLLKSPPKPDSAQ